jgi:hypothetical protein
MKQLLTFVTVAVLALASLGLLLAQSNPQVGTWKLNVAKSKYVNTQAPKNETRTVEPQGAGAKNSFDGVAGDGSRIAWSYTTNYDGKDSAISGVGAPMGADSIAVKRGDANTTIATTKKAGKAVRTTTTVVSKDGKVITITGKWTNEQGQPASQTSIWDKQ